MWFKKENKEKQLIDKELALYKEKAMLDIEKDLIRLLRKCAEDKGGYEHEFHQCMEDKKIELAKLDVMIEFRKKNLENSDLIKIYKNQVDSLMFLLENALSKSNSRKSNEEV